MLMLMAKKKAKPRTADSRFNMRQSARRLRLWRFVAEKKGLRGNITAWLNQLADKDCEPYLDEFDKLEAEMEREG